MVKHLRLPKRVHPEQRLNFRFGHIHQFLNEQSELLHHNIIQLLYAPMDGEDEITWIYKYANDLIYPKHKIHHNFLLFQGYRALKIKKIHLVTFNNFIFNFLIGL